MHPQKLSLSELPTALKSLGYVTSYYATYRAAIDGRLSGLVDRHNGRWVTSADRVPAIAEALGLSKQGETVAA